MAEGKKPDFIAKTVTEYEQNGEKKTRWTDIGIAYKNKEGYTILLNAHPMGDRIILRPPYEKE